MQLFPFFGDVQFSIVEIRKFASGILSLHKKPIESIHKQQE